MKKRKNMPEKDDVWEKLKQTRKKPKIDDSEKAEKDLETVMDAVIEKFKEKEEK